ncbi:MAG: DUF3857 domain-containing protein [Microbacter sp.]
MNAILLKVTGNRVRFLPVSVFRFSLRSVLMIMVLLWSAVSYAGKTPTKFGSVSNDEMNMTIFPADTSASAVVLYDKGMTYYEINQDFQVYLDVFSRIKILKQEGVDYANVEVPYVDYGMGRREYITGIDGYVYNKVGEKIEKSRLDKKYIFTDNEDNKHFRLKFSLPNVKAGSVIEFKYTIVSDFQGRIRPWRFQRSIPVVESMYDVMVPEYFAFHVIQKGYEPIDTKKGSENKPFVYNGGVLNVQCNHLTMTASNLPALKKEPYVINMSDYYTDVSFEISGLQVPGRLYKSFSQTWSDVAKQLMNDSEFGDNLKQLGLYKDEVNTIAASSMTPREKINAIYHLVQTKIKWNKKEALYTLNLKNAYKEGVGNSADINFALINMLKDAGFDAFPVVMSMRSEGRLPMVSPSINNLNYFVTGVFTQQDTLYMDASRKNAPVNVLDADYLVDRAMTVRGTDGASLAWVDLSHLEPSTSFDVCKITFDNGKIIANVTSSKNQESAYQFRETYESFKNQQERIDALQSRYGIVISDYSVQGLDNNTMPVIEKYTFSKPFDLSDSLIYLNPMMIFTDGSNPFKAEKRVLPVEFDYPFTDLTQVEMTLPKGYAIESLPKSEKTSIKQNDAMFRYLFQHENDHLKMMVILSMNETIFPVDEYNYLRDFWANLTAQENQKMILKRISL